MAELTTQTVAPTLPRAQNRVLKKFLGNKSAVIGALVVGFCLVALLAPWIALRPGQSQLRRCAKRRRRCTGSAPTSWGVTSYPALFGGAHLADGGLYVGHYCRGHRRAAGAGGGLLPEDVGRRDLALY